MHEKTLNGRITQRKKKMSQIAQTAENQDSPTGCVHSVATTEEERLSPKGKSKIPLVGIDLLGGDNNHPEFIIETLHGIFSKVRDPLRLLVFATPDIRNCIESFQELHSGLLPTESLCFFEVEEVIHMDDDPLLAIRRKKEASMCVGMRLLKEKKIDALVSTGNTGALIASARMYLPLLEGIQRSALITLLPTKKSPIAVLDVGANIECMPEHLVQFAQMGLAYQKSRGILNPRIGLLNIGTEEKKGRGDLRETYKLLQKFNSPNEAPVFIGNVEGKEIFSGNVDVLVTDGFTGNVFLKTSEGISSFILETLHENQAILPFSKPLLSRLEKELYSAESPGAILCGTDGIIMKCHGDANPEALMSGVQGALRLINGRFIAKMKEQLANLSRD
ncbi:phosphate acyltransferase [Simkania negevensis Z]|uniref:Phosphate acyltransferase n=1 Tax=Simkania negevensis (strain ATCC VR-1471 / DSM 27360 / Z) TaxID=331113 RepID=F8L392_SIMNZ|nr:phosphate acyltransferase [Simkania negevensis Z]